MIAPDDKLLSIDQVAEYLAVTAKHIRNLMKLGALTAVDVGVGGKRIWRFEVKEVQAFIERRRVISPEAKALRPARKTKSWAGIEVIDFGQRYRDGLAAKAARRQSGTRKPKQPR